MIKDIEQEMKYSRKRIKEHIITGNDSMVNYQSYRLLLNVKKLYPAYHAWCIIVDLKKKKNIDTDLLLKEIANHLK